MKLSPAQIEVLRHIVENGGGPLIQRGGGFWTLEGTKYADEPGQVWTWSTVIQTVRAMERKGLLERRGEPEWLAPRYLTDAGREAARELSDTPC